MINKKHEEIGLILNEINGSKNGEWVGVYIIIIRLVFKPPRL